MSLLLGAAFAAALALAAALPCAAATHTVTSTADDGSEGTLRYELNNAAEDDTIHITATGTIYLTSGRLVVNNSVTITGPGQEQLTVDAQQASPVFYIAPGTEVSISGLTIANGLWEPHRYHSKGGGIYLDQSTLTLSDCMLTNNQASLGGAIYIDRGELTLTDCTLSDNTAFGHFDPSGPNNEEDYEPTKGRGGAIYVETTWGDTPAAVTVERCTLSRNMASGYAGVSGAYGGGIFAMAVAPAQATVTVADSTLVENVAWGSDSAAGGAIAIGWVTEYDDDQSTAHVTIRNSTLSDNSAVGDEYGGVGGAIFNFKGLLTVDNSTLAGNFDNYADVFPGVTEFAGGAIHTALGPLKIRNTILANGPPGLNLFSMSLDEETLVEDLGYNLCTDDCSGLLVSTTNLLDIVDPMLGPLADNGGPTLTHTLLAGSPAIDAAAPTDSIGDPVEFDQRGVVRPQGIANDIGAVEVEQATANGPPTADPGGPYLAAVNAEFTVDGSASSDPDGDALSYSWALVTTITQNGGSPSFVAPAEPGIYPLVLTVNDGEGGADTASTSVVVYDASAGFVTGGGWIDSPAGAYFADPNLAGKATFGFVSKYRKGATVPTGNTAFEFAAGGLHLQSTSYEWLVVTGSDYARFKGTGTINGMGDYKFMVWAGDDEPDTFSIRIWQEDEATGVETDIYDNGFDQPIGGGSIVIHTK